MIVQWMNFTPSLVQPINSYIATGRVYNPKAQKHLGYKFFDRKKYNIPYEHMLSMNLQVHHTFS